MQENEQPVNALTDSNAESNSPVNGEGSELQQPVESSVEATAAENKPSDELPEAFKRRLGAQKTRYEKEIHKLKQTVEALSSSVPRQSEPVQSPSHLNVEPGSVEEKVLKTLTQLAETKKLENQRIEHQQQVSKLFEDGSKYEDFEDVVASPSVPISQNVLNAALDIPNSSDVLYALGKEYSENPHGSRLNNLVHLSPQQLRRKMVELSIELMTPKKEAKVVNDIKKPMPPLKSNPLAKTPSSVITEKSSVSEIRKHLKSINR